MHDQPVGVPPSGGSSDASAPVHVSRSTAFRLTRTLPSFPPRATFWASPTKDGRTLGCSTPTIVKTPAVARPSIRILDPFACEKIQSSHPPVPNDTLRATFWAIKLPLASNLPPASGLRPAALFSTGKLLARSGWRRRAKVWYRFRPNCGSDQGSDPGQ